MIGVGAYAGAQADLVVDSGVKLVLCHLNPQVAIAVRAANPYALIGLRADLGDDGSQVNFAGDPISQAAVFVRDRIEPAIAAVPKGTYSFCVGINEAWPTKGNLAGLRWRAAFELQMCRQMQNDYKLPYAWGAIPVGNLEPAEVPIFADVFREAWATNYHAYLGPGRSDLTQETDAYYCYRPVNLWFPELSKLNIRLRLLLGECGTYSIPSTYRDFGPNQEAATAIAITRSYEKLPLTGFEFVGGCAFGVGTVGTMAPWELSSAISIFQSAAIHDAQPGPIKLPGGPPVTPPTLPPAPKFDVGAGVLALMAQHGDTPQSDEHYVLDTTGQTFKSETFGSKGLYQWNKQANKTVLIPFS